MAEYDGVMLSDSMVIYAGDIAVNTTILGGGSQFVSEGGSAIGTTIVDYNGYQYVSEGGIAVDTTILKGIQKIYSGGVASNTRMSSDGNQQIYFGGVAISASILADEDRQLIHDGGSALYTVMSSGYQHINSGGNALHTVVYNGSQHINSGGQAISTMIDGGIQFVSSGASALDTVISAGEQQVYSGGFATGTVLYGGVQKVVLGAGVTNTVLQGGSQIVSKGGVASHTTVSGSGSMVVFNGGAAISTTLSDGGILDVLNGSAEQTEVGSGGWIRVSVGAAISSFIAAGGSATVYSEGKDKNARLAGAMTVAGTLTTAQVLSGGRLVMQEGARATYLTVNAGGLVTGLKVTGKNTAQILGTASNTTILSGGVLKADGTLNKTTIQSGGILKLGTGGKASGTSIKAGGSAHIASGARDTGAAINGIMSVAGKASSATVKKGGSLTLQKGGAGSGVTVLSGGVAAVRSGATLNKLTVSSGGKVELAGGSLTGTAIIKGNGLSIAAKGSKANKIKAGSRATISFDLRNVKAGKGTMLTLGNTWAAGNRLTVVAGKPQGIGTYRLAGGITAGPANSVTIKLGGSLLGYAAVNGDPFKKYGVSYAVSTGKNNSLSLTLSVAGGKMQIGNAHANTLTGTNASDIFYGGAGNDNITLKNGRDVAVYDAKAWGADVIGKANGTLTIVLAGLDKSKVKETLKGTTMTIAKKADATQKITVKGWSAETHNIVYNVAAADLKAFTEYRTAASPTEAQAKAAQNSVFKAAKLA